MMSDLWLKDCKIVPENIVVSIKIADGKIEDIKKISPKREETIDLKGSVVLPGLIDSHVHFRDPGLTYKEDFRTGSSAAANGGFTTVMDMPNTLPPTNTPRDFKDKMKIGLKKSVVDFGLHAGVADVKYIGALARLRPVSFKIFMDLADGDFLMEAFGKIKRDAVDHLISLHAEDQQLVKNFTEQAKKKGSAPELYAQARPALAEIDAVTSGLKLAREFNQKIHFCHISTKKSLKLIKDAQNAGIKVTSEITPHHLFLDSSYLKKFKTLAKTNPPLRDTHNRLEIKDLDKFNIIGTDHAPHTLKEKEKDIWEAPPGIPNLETTLPLLLTQFNRRNITITQIKRLLCENPARIFNLKNKGFIREGRDADLVVVDLKKEGVIDPHKFHSKAKYSPFEGFKLKGMPVMTLVRGNVVMDNGEILKHHGRFVYY